MSMILKNHMFKVDSGRFFKNASKFYFILWVAQRNKIGFK